MNKLARTFAALLVLMGILINLPGFNRDGVHMMAIGVIVLILTLIPPGGSNYGRK